MIVHGKGDEEYCVSVITPRTWGIGCANGPESHLHNMYGGLSKEEVDKLFTHTPKTIEFVDEVLIDKKDILHLQLQRGEITMCDFLKQIKGLK